MANPGSGADVFLRKVSDIVQKYKLSPQPLTLVHKPGGSGAIAVTYLAEKRGDDHTLMGLMVANTVAMLRTKLPVKPADLPAIARLQMDPNVWLVRADSPFKDVNQLLAKAKAEPKQISVGFGSIGSSDHLIFFQVAKSMGAEFNYVNFPSGGEAMAALLGGHVDMGSGQPSEALQQIRAGKLRGMITCSTDTRLELLPDVPTAKEAGINVTGLQFRGIVGPPEMPKEAVTYFESVMKKVSETDDWKSYIKETNVVSAYQNSAEFTKYIQVDLAPYLERLIGEMGLLQK